MWLLWSMLKRLAYTETVWNISNLCFSTPLCIDWSLLFWFYPNNTFVGKQIILWGLAATYNNIKISIHFEWSGYNTWWLVSGQNRTLHVFGGQKKITPASGSQENIYPCFSEYTPQTGVLVVLVAWQKFTPVFCRQKKMMPCFLLLDIILSMPVMKRGISITLRSGCLAPYRTPHVPPLSALTSSITKA